MRVTRLPRVGVAQFLGVANTGLEQVDRRDRRMDANDGRSGIGRGIDDGTGDGGQGQKNGELKTRDRTHESPRRFGVGAFESMGARRESARGVPTFSWGGRDFQARTTQVHARHNDLAL